MNGELADDPMRYLCSSCEARITHTYTHWANQFGISKRFFCHQCGMWEDRRLIYNMLGSFTVRTVHEGKVLI